MSNITSRVRDCFPDGLTLIEYSEGESLKLYVEGSMSSSWQLVMPNNKTNKMRLEVIRDAVNSIAE